ncbi:MAG TPA: hypothetical protein VF633_04845 [Brevundimonas sp.]|jgi:hypothetical protein
MRRYSMTTVTMVAAMGLTAAAAGPASALTLQDAPATVVRPGDDTLSCRQMADEGAALSADMGESGPGLLGRVGGIARAGAALLVPGAGLAVAGADALTSPAKNRREAEADTRRDRWNYLNGLYAGRGCDQGDARTSPVSQTPAVPPPASVVPGSASGPAPTASTTPSRAPASIPAPAITPASFPH